MALSDLSTEELLRMLAEQTQGAPTTEQKVRASVPMRVVQGMRDPIDAGAQMLPRALAGITSLGGALPNPVSNWLDAEGRRVGEGVQQAEQEYQAARQATTAPSLQSLVTGQRDPGFDWARMTGNIFSPANAAIAARVPIAGASMPVLAGRGAIAGAAGGALNPVTGPAATGPDTNFWANKATGAALGAVTGAALTPIMVKVADKVGQLVAARRFDPEQAQITADRLITDALRVGGVEFGDVAPDTLAKMREPVIAALRIGKRVDPAALARLQEFERLGIKPTAGQVSRDPAQFAAERNVRGMSGVGEPLLDRLTVQNQRLGAVVNELGAGAAAEPQMAGAKLAGAVRGVDERMRKGVTALYDEARSSSGREAEVPLQGLAQDVARIAKEYGSAFPSGLRNTLEDYGMLGGKQTKLMTAQDAEGILQQANRLRGNEPATNNAIRELVDAVKGAITGTGDDVFAEARKAAAARFAQQRAVPALEDAAAGGVSADNFVRQYVLSSGAETSNVQALAKLLREQAPEAVQTVRQQIAAHLNKAGFGPNAAGDNVFSPARYAEAIRSIGTGKLRAFFSPEEVAQLQAVGRVGAYINSEPVGAVVSKGTNVGALFNLGRQVGAFPLVKTIPETITRMQNNRTVATALGGYKPPNAANLSPEEAARLAQILGAGSGALGIAAGSSIR